MARVVPLVVILLTFAWSSSADRDLLQNGSTKPKSECKSDAQIRVPLWNQCGGKSGPEARDAKWRTHCCVLGALCQRSNAWYWQCNPDRNATTALPSPSPKAQSPPRAQKDESIQSPTPAPVPTPAPTPIPTPKPVPTPASKPAGGNHDYKAVLGMSYLFYEAQRSGPLPDDNRIKWRGDSFLNDIDPLGKPLAGGWFDAGDHVKFNLPGAWTLGVLAWGVLEFKDEYVASGQLPYALDSLRWAATFFMKCHVAPNTLVVQIGNGDVDHAIWNRPEDITLSYPVMTVDATSPGSDVAGAMSAGLAATAMVFKGVDDNFAAKCLTEAMDIYRFGKNFLGKYSESVPNAAAFYKSNSYYDDLAFAAGMLFKATNNQAYKTESLSWMDKAITIEKVPWNGFDWDNNQWAASMMHAIEFGDVAAKRRVQDFIFAWIRGTNGVKYTPKGLAWFFEWGALRHTSNAGFLVALYAKRLTGGNTDQRDLLYCFNHKMVGYILGDSGQGFVVGYGKNGPCRPHHRGSSCPDPPQPCSWTDYNAAGCNPQPLIGALVGGPDASDKYADERGNYINNEVTTDYNAGFTGVLASLVKAPISKAQCAKKGLLQFPTTAPLF